MKEKSLADLDSRLQKQLNEAVDAIRKGSASYAINVASGVLAKYPEAYEARIILWKAVQLKRGSVVGFLTRLSGWFSGRLFKFSMGKLLRQNPIEAIRQCDVSVSKGSISSSHCDVLILIADLLCWTETAVSSSAMLVDLNPKNVQFRLKYGKFLLRSGRSESAVEQAEVALSIEPSNRTALDLLKDASIAGAVQKSNWDESKSMLDRLNS